MNVTIIGVSTFGTALGKVLSDNGHAVSYYDPIGHPEQSLSAIVNSSEVNILAIPPEAIGKLILFIPYNKPLICVSKGFFSAEKFKDFKQFSVLAGSAFAADLVAKKPTTFTATSEIAGKIFKNSWLSFEYTDDVLGVLLCGTLNRIYAIGAGYRKMTYEAPEFNDYIRTAYSEIRFILATNGADPSTANYTCGAKDLIVNCGSSTSIDYRFGEQLRQDPDLARKLSTGELKLNTPVEGYTALRALADSELLIPPEATLLDETYRLALPLAESLQKRKGVKSMEKKAKRR